MIINNKTTFTLNGLHYSRDEKNGYCYKTVEYEIENGKMHRQTTRIGKSEFNKAMQEHDDMEDAKMREAVKRLVEEQETEEIRRIQEEMMRKEKKGMSFEAFIALAKKHYSEGGDGIVECWDINTYNQYVKEYGPITKKVAYSIIGIEAPKAAPRAKKVQVGGMEFTEGGVSVIITPKQVEFIRLLPTSNFWENGVDSALWIDVLCDELEDKMGPMTIGAMVSTLREKHLLEVAVDCQGKRKAKYFRFTNTGKAVAAKVLGL